MNHLKDIIVDWKFKEDNSSKDVDDALKWWKMHATTDPLTASAAHKMRL